MVRGSRISAATASFIFALTSAIMLAFMAYGYFNGTTSANLEALRGRMETLERDVRDLQRERRER